MLVLWNIFKLLRLVTNLRLIYLHSVSVSCPLEQGLAPDRSVSALLVQAASFLCLCFPGMLPLAEKADSILAPNLHFVCLLWMDSTHYLFTSSLLYVPLTIALTRRKVMVTLCEHQL